MLPDRIDLSGSMNFVQPAWNVTGDVTHSQGKRAIKVPICRK